MKRFLIRFSLFLLVMLAAATAIFWTPDTDTAAMRAKYGTPPSQFVDLGNGLTVHLRDEGPRDAPVVMLLHGSNSSLHTWDDWTKRLTPKYRVIRLDLPGHGLTGADPGGGYGTSDYVDVVDRVTTKLGIVRFVLAGNSMGGGVSWAYAHKYPEKLTGLGLIDAAGAPPDTKSTSLPIGFRIARTPGLRNMMLYITPRSMIDKSVRQSVANGAAVTLATVDRYWELLRYPGNRQATIIRFGAPRDSPLAGAPRLPTPTLIMWGAKDTVLPVSGVKWFQSQVPEGKTVIYPNVGHLPMEETPEQSAADFGNWLATLPPPR